MNFTQSVNLVGNSSLQYRQFILRFYLALNVPTFKGTVRSDWIWMRVVPLESSLKGHQLLYVFDFLISVLNIWINFKVLSRFMQNEPNLLLVRIKGCIKSVFLLAGALLFDKKNPPKWPSILVWIAEWWMQAATQRTIDASPAFMEYGLAKKIVAWAHANRDPNKQEDWI